MMKLDSDFKHVASRGALRRILFAAATLSVAAASPVAAQVAGAPVFYSMKHDPNHSVHADWGHAGRDADGNYVGIRYTRAFGESNQGPLRVSGMLGALFGPGDDAVSVGLSAGLAILRQRLIQAEPSLGIGWTGGPVSRLDIPFGVAIGVVGSLPPSPATRFASENPQIWLAPRMQLRVADDADGSRALRGGFGGGAGLELRWRRGFGLQFLYELLAMRDAMSPVWRTESAFGLSAFFAWI